MLHYIPFEELSEFYGLPIDQLKTKSYNDLETLTDQMKTQKAHNEALQNKNDKEYIRIVKKYLTPYAFLKQYFSEPDIIAAASKHASVRSLVNELPLPKGTKCSHSNAEYIRTSIETLRQFDSHGHELLYGKPATCDVYRIPAKFQGLIHGNIILELLYNKYPQLKEFNFKAYEYHACNAAYEIYPDNHIYTPFEALLKKDIDAIIARNENYAASYNAGIYTKELTQERLKSDEAKHFFDVILTM